MGRHCTEALRKMRGVTSLRRVNVGSAMRSSLRGFASISVDNPFTGEEFCQVQLMEDSAVSAQRDLASEAQREWSRVPLSERIAVVERFVSHMENNVDDISHAITGQMGKPIGAGAGEVRGLAERARGMMDLAPKALGDVTFGATPNNQDPEHFRREIVREPVGVVLTLAPWNFPLLTAVNSVVPAVLAGNAVVLSHGFRTPLMADHFAKAFEAAGAPTGLVSALKCDYEVLHRGIRGGLYDFVSFTGSVSGGRAVNESVGLSRKFIDCTLELGGNDAAYVAEDCDLDYAVAGVVDGGMYNSGQSCCGVERAFVHESLYDSFLEKAVAEVGSAYGVVGDPMDPNTNVGPLAQPGALGHLSALVADAKQKGARVLVGESEPVSAVSGQPRLFRPTLLADCDDSMEVMVEESFGPLIAIQKVSSQEEAIAGINKSKYGLTSIIFTNDESNAETFAEQADTGTVFMNRCDYLDPYLAWQGRKDTGKGLSLSQFGFDSYTKLKNHHFKRL